MDHATHLSWVGREADAYRAALATADLSAPVGACPGWTVADLTEHLGTVHRWAALAVGMPPGDQGPSYDRPDDDGLTLTEWYDAAAATLVDTLTGAGADRSCWTMAHPRTAAFWSRRQAHELAVHRWDLESAVGAAGPIDPTLARDGVAEVLDTMLPRQVRLERIAATPDWLRLVVDGEELALATMSEGRDPEPVGTVIGRAEDVLLTLWGRPPSVPIELAGDVGRVGSFLGRAHVP